MVKKEIERIYHEHNGIDGYRTMKIYLEREGYTLSLPTVHKYMNKEMKLISVVRPKKPDCRPGKAHKVFENKINQNYRY